MSLYYLDANAASDPGEDTDIETKDPSLNGQGAGSLAHEFKLTGDAFSKLFLTRNGIDYIGAHFSSHERPLRVVTHPRQTNTCFEKAALLGSWNPLNVIKALYFEHSVDGSIYAAVVPETGCFIDRSHFRGVLRIQGDGPLRKASKLPSYMTFGTCSPFIAGRDLRENGGKVEKLLFDSETLMEKRRDKSIDDFSFGADHRMSIQMNYYDCFRMMKRVFPEVVAEGEVLGLSFKEKFNRVKGRIGISYEFNSLNYRTAKFINSIHGYGDVSIYNDYVDELDLPNALSGAMEQVNEP
jgi:hypothetical protein